MIMPSSVYSRKKSTQGKFSSQTDVQEHNNTSQHIIQFTLKYKVWDK